MVEPHIAADNRPVENSVAHIAMPDAWEKTKWRRVIWRHQAQVNRRGGLQLHFDQLLQIPLPRDFFG